MTIDPSGRRRWLAAGAALGLASWTTARGTPAGGTPLPSMTEGPFYPPRRWRLQQTNAADWDADLTRVTHGSETLVARGEHLGLALTVRDGTGRAIDQAEVEIWQCDAMAVYTHPDVAAGPTRDRGFQGFGAAMTDRQGQLRFRTIRPVPYPGRTPHIHVKLRHPSFGEWTSQLFVTGDPGNARDFIWRRLDAAQREAAGLQLEAAGSADGLRWQARHAIVLPA